MGEGNAATKGAKGRTSDGDPQIIIYETEQQQEQNIKDDKKRHRKEIMKPNYTVEWIREWLALIMQLDGTGGHERLSKRA
jgi:hypothetical protein